MAVKSWALSDPGTVRQHNEDNLLSRPELGLWAVADGAGGHESGEAASALIVSELARLPAGLSSEALIAQTRATMGRVHATLRDMARARGGKVLIASTFVALILRDDRFICLWAGDSRLYLLRHGELSMVSRDHSLVQELIDSGNLAPEAAEGHPHANIITRAAGADAETLELDMMDGQTLAGDLFLLCSDGLNKSITDAQITAMLVREDAQPAQTLVEAALAQGAKDNVTAIVIKITG